MPVTDFVSSSLGRSDGSANIALAEKLCRHPDEAAIAELVRNLSAKKGRLASDCLEVLEEIGKRKPELIAPYVQDFLALLRGRNNRLIWGAMVALSTIAAAQAPVLEKSLPLVLQAAEHGSVITVDYAVSVLAAVAAARPSAAKQIVPWLLEHLATCRPKEIAQHAERSLPAVTPRNKEQFAVVLARRSAELTDAQRKRASRIARQIDGVR